MKAIFSSIKIKAIIILLLAGAPGLLHATDYYVSSSGGHDNENGTSPATAWASLARVRQNIINYAPGDRILFKRGDVFYGFLQFSSPAVGWGGHAQSGTDNSPITIGAYGTGDLPVIQYDPNDPIDPYDPVNGSGDRFSRNVIMFAGVDYWTVENINFTDVVYTSVDHYGPSHNTCAIQMGYPGQDDLPTRCNHMLIKNCEISLCGLGVVINGDNNKVTHCNMSRFNNVKSTMGTYTNSVQNIDIEDYGANGVTICGNYNEVSYNDIRDAWAESLDFAWNGGALEMVDVCQHNLIIYNSFSDCGGIAEFGGLARDLTTGNNVFAYNKIVNCGGLTYCNIDQQYAITVENNQWYNNVIIETEASRFSGGNAGEGLQDPVAIAHLVPDHAMFQYGSTPITGIINVVRNNIFQISSGMEGVFKNGGDPHLEHSNNLFQLSNGAQVNVTMDPTEILTSVNTNLFTDITDPNPINWDFYPADGSPQIGAGVTLTPPITLDFNGNTVADPPTMGPLEYLGITQITVGSISPTSYCTGTAISIPFTADATAAPGNIFYAVMYDPYYPGLNAPEYAVGSIASTTGGTIQGTIPSVSAGTYVIKVTSSTAPSAHLTASSLLTINETPVVSAGSYGPVSYGSAPVTLSGIPAGGTFSGPGVTGNVFYPAAAGAGSATVTYTYTNGSGCTASQTTNITVNCNFSVGSISGPSNPCTYAYNSDVAYSVAYTDASSFNWSITSTPANSATIYPNGSAATVRYASNFVSGTISVSVGNPCGGQAVVVNLPVNASVPAPPAAINGPGNACGFIGTSNHAFYSVDPVPNATGYTWTVPAAGAQIIAGQGTSTIEVAFTNDFVSGTFITVKAFSYCGNGQAIARAIVKTAPQTPSLISGPTDVCQYMVNNTLAVYSVTADPGASSYTWTVNGQGASLYSGQGSNSIMVAFDGFPGTFNTGTITVVANNSCGTSSMRTLTIKQAPATPGAISGETNPCPGYIGDYDVPFVPGNFLYVWTTSPTMTIIAGLGTRRVTVQYANNFTTGLIRVSAHTVCGNSGQRTLNVSACSSSKGTLTAGGDKVDAGQVTAAIYPNPSNGDFRIMLDNYSQVAGVNVDITNELGVLVHKAQVPCKNGLMMLNLRGKLSAGIYYVSFIVNGEKKVKKLIVSN